MTRCCQNRLLSLASRRRTWLSVAVTLLLVLPLIPTAAPASAALNVNSRFAAALAAYPGVLAPSPEDELEGMKTELIDPAMDATEVMRSRPFIVGETALELGFPDKARLRADRSLDEEDGARAALVAFLQLRGVDGGQIDAAAARFDDRKTKKIIPSTRLRAAVLMLTGWEPYDAVIGAILDGDNPSGDPFVGVVFENVGVKGAIATLADDPVTGKHTLTFSSEYDNELPQVLIPTIVHEALHGGGGNSAEEEIVANLLDTICWGELLLIQPDLATVGSDLAYFGNVTLLGLLNSSGRAGPEQLGVATSPVGDIYVGNGLEDADAESLRAMVESEWFYDALLNVGSPGQQTTAALLSRFPGGKALGEAPAYDETMLAVIDAGVYKILPADKAVKLAAMLGLERVVSFKERTAKGKLSDDWNDDLSRRPFIVTDQRYFAYGSGKKTPKALDEDGGRAALQTALERRDLDQSAIDAILAQYDADTTRALIDDPSLRAAVLLLTNWQPWDYVFDVILNGKNPDGVPLRIFFTPMRDSAPAARQSDLKHDGTPAAILVNSLLKGESPELLASVIVEATLLHDDTLLKEEAIAAATFGTLAWIDIVDVNPKAAAGKTWGVLQRNQYVLALLNTASTDGKIGILAENGEKVDILPGVYADAPTFARFVDLKPWGVRFDRNSELVAPKIFISLLTFAGIEPQTSTGGIVTYGDATLRDLDAVIASYVTPEKALAVATALELGTAIK